MNTYLIILAFLISLVSLGISIYKFKNIDKLIGKTEVKEASIKGLKLRVALSVVILASLVFTLVVVGLKGVDVLYGRIGSVDTLAFMLLGLVLLDLIDLIDSKSIKDSLSVFKSVKDAKKYVGLNIAYLSSMVFPSSPLVILRRLEFTHFKCVKFLFLYVNNTIIVFILI